MQFAKIYFLFLSFQATEIQDDLNSILGDLINKIESKDKEFDANKYNEQHYLFYKIDGYINPVIIKAMFELACSEEEKINIYSFVQKSPLNLEDYQSKLKNVMLSISRGNCPCEESCYLLNNIKMNEMEAQRVEIRDSSVLSHVARFKNSRRLSTLLASKNPSCSNVSRISVTLSGRLKNMHKSIHGSLIQIAGKFPYYRNRFIPAFHDNDMQPEYPLNDNYRLKPIPNLDHEPTYLMKHLKGKYISHFAEISNQYDVTDNNDLVCIEYIKGDNSQPLLNIDFEIFEKGANPDVTLPLNHHTFEIKEHDLYNAKDLKRYILMPRKDKNQVLEKFEIINQIIQNDFYINYHCGKNFKKSDFKPKHYIFILIGNLDKKTIDIIIEGFFKTDQDVLRQVQTSIVCMFPSKSSALLKNESCLTASELLYKLNDITTNYKSRAENNVIIKTMGDFKLKPIFLEEFYMKSLEFKLYTYSKLYSHRKVKVIIDYKKGLLSHKGKKELLDSITLDKLLSSKLTWTINIALNEKICTIQASCVKERDSNGYNRDDRILLVRIPKLYSFEHIEYSLCFDIESLFLTKIKSRVNFDEFVPLCLKVGVNEFYSDFIEYTSTEIGYYFL